MRVSGSGALLLVAFSAPVAVELRTVFGLFGVDLPLAAVVAAEAAFLLAVAAAYWRGRDADRSEG